MTAKIIQFEEKEPVCSFCKKPKSKVKNLIAGINNFAFICDECLKKCTKLKDKE